MSEPQITAPEGGARITIADGQLQVPANPIIPFIEGDGTAILLNLLPIFIII